jgi:hypothetical protein
MPYFPNPPTVLEYDSTNLPRLTEAEKSKLPDSTRSLILVGGAGGGLGEKSYKAEVLIGSLDIATESRSVNIQNAISTLTTSNIVKINSENDAGYAINCVQDAQNKCTLNINKYSSIPDVSIYQTGTFLNFTGCFSGVVNNGSAISDGGSFGDFTLESNSNVTPQQDTNFDLNRYYINLFNSNDLTDSSKGIHIQKSIDFTNLDNLFCFYVVEMDYQAGMLAFSQAEGIYSTSAKTIQVSSTSSQNFALGDRLKISDPDDLYSAVGIVSSCTSSSLTLSNVTYFNYRNSLSNSLNKNFSIGSSISPCGAEFDLPDLKFSMLSKDALTAETKEYFSENYNIPAFNLGLHSNIYKKITTNNKETVCNFNLLRDCFGILTSLNTAETVPISKVLPKLFSRSYAIDQYGTDAQKLLIKNKQKFCLFYNGVVKDRAGYSYFCGSDNLGTFFSYRVNNQDPFLSESSGYLIIGQPFTKNDSGSFRAFYSVKLYETLVYKNLQFPPFTSYDPLEIIRKELINKYKQKLYINAPVELSSSSMYYNTTDRLNILGKIKNG